MRVLIRIKPSYPIRVIIDFRIVDTQFSWYMVLKRMVHDTLASGGAVMSVRVDLNAKFRSRTRLIAHHFHSLFHGPHYCSQLKVTIVQDLCTYTSFELVYNLSFCLFGLRIA